MQREVRPPQSKTTRTMRKTPPSGNAPSRFTPPGGAPPVLEGAAETFARQPRGCHVFALSRVAHARLRAAGIDPAEYAMLQVWARDGRMLTSNVIRRDVLDQSTINTVLRWLDRHDPVPEGADPLERVG